MQPQVFDNGRRRSNEQRRHGRNRCGNRADNRNAGKPRRQSFHNGARNNIVNASTIRGQVPRKHARGKHAERGNANHHGADNNGATDHRTAQALRIFVAHAAHYRLWQRERENANEQPLREVQRHGHGAARKGLKHLRMVRANGAHDAFPAAARNKNACREHHDAHEHSDAAQRVGHGYAAETAHRRENNHSNAENGQANKIRIPRHGFKQLRAAHELGNHSCRKEQHDNQSRSIRQRIAAEAGTNHIDHRDRPKLTRNKRHLLAHNAVEQKQRRYLHGRHIHPTKACLPRLARAAHKRAHRAIGGNGSHGQYKTAKRAVADEVFLHESAFARSTRAATRRNREPKSKYEENEHGKQARNTSCLHRAPPHPNRNRRTPGGPAPQPPRWRQSMCQAFRRTPK